MIIVTKQEFVAWLESLPKDHPFKIVNNLHSDEICCPMMGYARAKNIPAMSVTDHWYDGSINILAKFEDGFGFRHFRTPENENCRVEITAETVLNRIASRS